MSSGSCRSARFCSGLPCWRFSALRSVLVCSRAKCLILSQATEQCVGHVFADAAVDPIGSRRDVDVRRRTAWYWNRRAVRLEPIEMKRDGLAHLALASRELAVAMNPGRSGEYAE